MEEVFFFLDKGLKLAFPTLAIEAASDKPQSRLVFE